MAIGKTYFLSDILVVFCIVDKRLVVMYSRKFGTAVPWVSDFSGTLQAKLPAAEIAAAIDEFRSNHLSELREV